MTVQAHAPIPLPGGRDLGTAAARNRSARLLGSAKSLLRHGLVVLVAAILLGVAEALSLWMGALLVAFGLLVVAGAVALIAVVSRLGVRPRH